MFYGIQVVRIPEKGVYTCHGGGFIASGGIEKVKAPVIYLPQGGQLDPMEGAGEVQTPVRFNKLKSPLEIGDPVRSEEHTSELQSRGHLVCRLLLEKKKSR